MKKKYTVIVDKFTRYAIIVPFTKDDETTQEVAECVAEKNLKYTDTMSVFPDDKNTKTNTLYVTL